MRTHKQLHRPLRGAIIGFGAVMSACLPLIGVAAGQKERAPPPVPTHAAAPTPAGQHPAGGAPGGAAALHRPTTNGDPGAGHAITTGNAGASRVTTAGPAGARPGGAVASRPGVSAAGGRPGGAGGATSFAGHPVPAGGHELHAANDAAVRTRADGSRSDVHDPKRGMDIHRGLDGNRRVAVERTDHTRIVAERGGRGYVQHPYMFHGREFGHRTYFEHGRAYDRFYGRYEWYGHHYDVYAPARFYPYGFYGYAYAPWGVPVPYAWGWGGAPWYEYYGAFYTPYPVYAAPAFWLADFVIAASLRAAYAAQAFSAAASGPVSSNRPTLLAEGSRWVADLLVGPAEADAKPSTPMTPQVKQMVADEIKALLQQEGTEAQANAANQDADPGKDSVIQLLSDNRPHVLVAGTDLDLVTGSGQECAFSQGDVLKVMSPPAAGADTASAAVLASKGGKECASGANVSVAISDLQDMHNHMREQIDDGLSELQSKQGHGGLPAAPASAIGAPVKAGFAAGAPPPDATAAGQIKQQANEADQAEREVSASVASASAGNSGSSTTIALGQTIDQVSAALGNPSRIVDFGAKKIYAYPDMKIIFQNGKVSDVQ
jgi:hypothetical protein